MMALQEMRRLVMVWNSERVPGLMWSMLAVSELGDLR